MKVIVFTQPSGLSNPYDFVAARAPPIPDYRVRAEVGTPDTTNQIPEIAPKPREHDVETPILWMRVILPDRREVGDALPKTLKAMKLKRPQMTASRSKHARRTTARLIWPRH